MTQQPQSSFLSTLQREVKDIKKRLNLTDSKAFLVWFAKVSFEITEEDALEGISVDGSNDKGIDLFTINHDDGKVIIVQGKYSASGNHTPKLGSISKLQASLQWLSSPEALRRDGMPDLAAAADDYLEAVREGYGIELWFAYCGRKHANVEREIDVFNKNIENVDARRSCRLCDISVLQSFWEEFTGKAKRLTSETLSFAEGRYFEYIASFGNSLVGTVYANELVRLYKSHGDRLFDRNVRLFLGAKKGSINAGIAETLKSEKKSNFWAYNNGLTFVCSDFSLDEAASSVQMRNFCIVNGCQSTRSLAEQRENLDATVTVLVRVLAVGESIVDEVIQFTNSQNPIRPWDLASQHKTQRRLKRDFDNLQKPWAYITRRGDRPSADMKKYKDGRRVRQIKLSDVGQFMAALADRPVMAYKNKAFIFSTRHDDVFPHDIKVEEVLFAHVCSEAVKCAVADRRISEDTTEDERRILIKGGPIFVMAVLGNIARLRNGACFMKQLDEDQIVSNAASQRLKAYARYAVETYLSSVIDSLEMHPDELSTAIRQPSFYEKVRDRANRAFRKDKLAGEDWLKKVLPKLANR